MISPKGRSGQVQIPNRDANGRVDREDTKCFMKIIESTGVRLDKERMEAVRTTQSTFSIARDFAASSDFFANLSPFLSSSMPSRNFPSVPNDTKARDPDSKRRYLLLNWFL